MTPEQRAVFINEIVAFLANSAYKILLGIYIVVGIITFFLSHSFQQERDEIAHELQLERDEISHEYQLELEQVSHEHALELEKMKSYNRTNEARALHNA